MSALRAHPIGRSHSVSTMSVTNPGDETIRVASSQVRALSNVHPGVWGAVKEVFANAEGYCTAGITPYCDAVLVNETMADMAYIYFRSHSLVTGETASHIFDLGHLQDAVKQLHRRFNIGTYIVAGKMCRPGKEGMSVISFDPVARSGIVMRAYVNEDGFVCKVNPVTINLDGKGMPTLMTRETPPEERNRIEKLWLGTQWEAGEFNQGASHRDYCSMIYETTVKHAMEGKGFATTTFLYFDLKTVMADGKNTPECFLKSTTNDILERNNGSPAYGFRNTLREHFLPHVNRMPLITASETKKRTFLVMNSPVTLTQSGSDDAPWIARVVKVVNESRVGNTWYPMSGGDVMVKFASVDLTAAQTIDNFRTFSRHVIGATLAMPVGAIVTHFDKVISKTPFGLNKGEPFQLCPEAATHWEPLANTLLSEGRIKPTHIDLLWTLMGLANAKLECVGETEAIRSKHLSENSNVLGIDQSGTKGYKYLCQLLIRPFRKVRNKVDVEGVKSHVGVFNMDDYLDEATKEINYMSKQAVRDARAAGEFSEDANYSSRMPLMEVIGLRTAAVLQVGNCEQPMDKERLLDSTDSRRFYRDYFQCLVHHVLCHPTKEVASMHDAFIAKWREVEGDSEREDRAARWIQEERLRRIEADKKKKEDARLKAEAKAVDEERKRLAAEKKAADEQRKREDLERRQAEGARSSERLAQEQAQRNEAVQIELKKAQKLAEAATRKEARLKQQETDAAKQKAEKEQLRREELQRKADARESRGKAAMSVFSTAVSALTDSFGWPEAMIVQPQAIDGKGDLFPRSKGTKDTTRINEGHQVIEAVAYAFKTETLATGTERELEPWVTGEMAKKMLCSLMEDNHMPKALGLEYNWRNKVAGEKRKASLLATGTAAAATLALLPDDEVSASGAVPPAKKQRGESSNAPLLQNVQELDDLGDGVKENGEEPDDVEDEEEEVQVDVQIAEID